MTENFEDLIIQMADELPTVLCSVDDIDKFIGEYDEQGYSLACVSNVSTPAGMVRLTFLKKDNFSGS